MGRTQQGNNNAYCQENEITWFDWSAPDTGLLEFTKRVGAARLRAPGHQAAGGWQVDVDTHHLASPTGLAAQERKAGDPVTVGPRSMVVLKNPRQG